MSDLELLNRVQAKDRDAFVELMKKYGVKLYSRLLVKLGDRQLADAAFKETMVGFYKSLTENEGEDAISAFLAGYGDNVSDRLIGDYFDHIVENTADCVESAGYRKLNLPVPELEEEENTYYDENDVSGENEAESPLISRKGWIFAVSLLSTCALLVIWVIIGLLCGMGIIPELDLGYTWFNNNVAEWF